MVEKDEDWIDNAEGRKRASPVFLSLVSLSDGGRRTRIRLSHCSNNDMITQSSHLLDDL